MTDFLRIALIFLLAVNPALVANALRGRVLPLGQLGLGAAIAVAVYLLLVLGADGILDALAIEPETAQIAAGTLMAVGGGLAVVGAGREYREIWSEKWPGVLPFALPLLITPAGVVAAISFGANESIGTALGASVIAVVVAAGMVAGGLARFGPAADGLARLSGTALVLLSAGLIVDGVKSV